jgi:predicted nucleotidyltransferase
LLDPPRFSRLKIVLGSLGIESGAGGLPDLGVDGGVLAGWSAMTVRLAQTQREGRRFTANCGSFEAMTTSEIVERAGRLLADAAPPESKVILFGSHGRGDADADSDFDFLVIEPSVAGKAKEMVRLRDALDPLRVAADVVVVAREYVEEWSAVPGTMLHHALTEGRVLAET